MLLEQQSQLIITPHPLLLDGQRNTVWAARPGESLYGLLMRNVLELDGQPWAVSIGGLPVERHLWHHVYPKAGQVIEVRGGVGRSALAIVAMIALTYFTFGGGAIAGFSLGTASTLGTLAVQSAVYVAGSMLINKVLAPKPPKAIGQQQDSVYSISGARNQLRPHEPLPLLFGRVRITPDLLSTPYTWFEGNDQYLGLLLCAGVNVGRVEAFYNGDTELANYEGVQVYHAGYSQMPDQSIPLYSNADTIDGAELTDDKAWVERTTSADTVRIQINIEYVLGGTGTSGKSYNVSETVEAQYRLAGTAGWQPLVSQSFRSDRFDVRRATLAKDVPPGQYDVRVRMLGYGNYSGKNTQKNDFQWTTLTSVQVDEADYTGLSRTGVRIKATGQLNGSPDELRAVGHADPIPVWDGGAWSTAESSNPGAHILAYARGIVRDGRLLGGMALSDEQIDIESLKAFSLHCAANGYTYDCYIKDARNHDQVLAAIALAGFGQTTWAGGRLGVVWVAQEQPLSGVVNMATIKKGQFQVDYSLSNAADGIEYAYLDAATWETKTLRVPAPGVTTMLNPAQISGEGVTSEAHAACLARWHLAQSLYQYKDIGYSTDIEHLSYQRLSLLALQHDMTQWGFGGRVVAATDAAGSVTLILDEPVPAPASGNAYIGLRIPGERVYRVLRVKPFTGESSVIELLDAWPSDAAVPGNSPDNPAHDTLWVYDFKQTPGLRVRVVSIEPESDLKGAAVRVVQEGPEFWNYVLTGHYVPSPNESQLQTRPVASNLRITEQQVVQGNTQYTELTATFDITGPVANILVLAAGEEQELREVAQTQTRTATWRIAQADVYSIVVRPFSPDGIAGVAISATYATDGADVPPVLVDLFDVQQRSGGVRLYTWGWLEDTMRSADYAGVEIRYIAGHISAPDWEAMTPIGDTGYHTAAFEAVVPASGQWTFSCRSRNTAGELSVGSRVVTVTLSANLAEHIGGIGQELEALTQQQLAQQQAVDQAVQDQVAGDLANAQAIAAEAIARNDAIVGEANARVNAIGAEALARTSAIKASAAESADNLLNTRVALEAFVSTEATIRQSADSSLANQIATISAGTGEQFDTGGGIWYFDSDTDGWTSDSTISAVDGWLRVGPTSSPSPFMLSPPLSLDSLKYRYVKTRIRKSASIGAWRGVIHWITTADQAWGASKELVAPEPAWGADDVATLDLRDIPWSEGVIRIRLFLFYGPVTASAYWENDWIAIGRPSPGASAAGLQEEREARITGDSAQTTVTQTLAAQMRGSYDGTDVDLVTSGLVFSERQARATAIGAVATDVQAISVRMPAGNGAVATEASVTAETQARVSADESLAQRSEVMEARMPADGGRLATEARVITAEQAAASANEATAGRVNLLEVRMPAGSAAVASDASVQQVNQASVDRDGVLAESVSTVSTKADNAASSASTAQTAANNAASIASSAQTAANNAQSTATTALDVSNSNATAIMNVQQKTSIGPNMLKNPTFAQGSQGWGASIGGNLYLPVFGHYWGFPAVSGGAAKEQVISDVGPGVYVLSGQIWRDSSTGVVRLEAAPLTAAGDIIGSVTVLSNPAILGQWQDVYIPVAAPGNTGAFKARLVVENTDLGAYVRRLKVEPGLLPTLWTDEQTMAGTASATQTLQAGYDSVDGRLKAKVTTALDVNGNVSGTVSENDGTRSSFSILASVFRVISSLTGMGMEWLDGYLRIWKGSAQLLLGHSFGSGDLVMWYGPNVGAASCTKTNSLFHLDTTGGGYFGGALSAGTLKNAVQTTTTVTIGTELINGPFETNGNTRSVILSFTRTMSYVSNAFGTSGFSAGAGANTATVQLYRKVGATAETLWQTLSVSGSIDILNEADAPDRAYSRWFGALTVNDASVAGQQVTYRAIITGFTSQALNHPGTINSISTSQNLAIIATEQ